MIDRIQGPREHQPADCDRLKLARAKLAFDRRTGDERGPEAASNRILDGRVAPHLKRNRHLIERRPGLFEPFLQGTSGAGTNPEQLLAAGWSACFLSAVKLIAGKKKIALPADVAIAPEDRAPHDGFAADRQLDAAPDHRLESLHVGSDFVLADVQGRNLVPAVCIGYRVTADAAQSCNAAICQAVPDEFDNRPLGRRQHIRMPRPSPTT